MALAVVSMVMVGPRGCTRLLVLIVGLERRRGWASAGYRAGVPSPILAAGLRSRRLCRRRGSGSDSVCSTTGAGEFGADGVYRDSDFGQAEAVSADFAGDELGFDEWGGSVGGWLCFGRLLQPLRFITDGFKIWGWRSAV